MYLPMSANRKMNYRDNLYKTHRMQKDCSQMIYNPVLYKVVDWNLDLLHLLPRLGVPHTHRLVLRARHDVPTIRREGHRHDVVRGPGEVRDRSVRQVVCGPELNCAVDRTAHDHFGQGGSRVREHGFHIRGQRRGGRPESRVARRHVRGGPDVALGDILA